MIKVFTVELKIAATAYVKADSVADAIAKVTALNEGVLVLCDQDAEAIEICDKPIDDPLLPALSLSPYMTIKGQFYDDDAVELA